MTVIKSNKSCIVSECYDQYYEKINNIIKLSKINITHDLPKVLVIGSESSGKSSLLENIIKCEIFPKNYDFCTKLPIHVIMKTVYDINDVKYNITYKNEKSTFEIKSIYSKIKEIMDNLNDIYEDEILVEIYDMNIINFEFYDLPGICEYPQEMKVKTTNLVKKYIQMENVIPICVIPSTTPRLTASSSLALILELKKEQNTILCLTMCDRLSQDNLDELLINRILKQSKELDYTKFVGICGVINRNNKNKVTLEEINSIEAEWFNTNIITTNENVKDKLGIKNLLKLLTNYYKEYISTFWIENFKLKINEEIQINNKKIEDNKLIIKNNEKYYEFIKEYLIDDIMYRYFGTWRPTKKFIESNTHYNPKKLIENIMADINLYYNKFSLENFEFNYSKSNSLVLNKELFEKIFNTNLNLISNENIAPHTINNEYNDKEISENLHFNIKNKIFKSNNDIHKYFEYLFLEHNIIHSELSNFNNLFLEINKKIKSSINFFINSKLIKEKFHLNYDFIKREYIDDFRFIIFFINNILIEFRVNTIAEIKRKFDSMKENNDKNIILEQEMISKTINELTSNLDELDKFKNSL